MKLKNITLKYDYNFFQTYFIEKYDLNHLERNYFRYLDGENIFLFEDDEYEKLSKLTIQINSIFKKAYEFYLDDFEKNLDDLSEFKDYFKKNYSVKHFVGRYDVLIDENGDYKFIELNANTPGLITDVYDIASMNKSKNYENISEKFIDYIGNFYKKYKGKKLGILLPYSYEDEDYLVCADYKDIINKFVSNEDIIIGDITESNIIADDFFTIKGEKIDVLLSFFPLEFFLSDLDYLHSFLNILKLGNLELYNPIESIVLQDKLIYAVIWEKIDKFTKLEQDFIKKHIPFSTRKFSDNKERFIAKDRFGRIGRGVYEDNFYSKVDDKKKFIFQEKIISKKFDNEDNFMVLGLYTDMNNLLTVVGRKQKEFITKDGNNKVVLCYK